MGTLNAIRPVIMVLGATACADVTTVIDRHQSVAPKTMTWAVEVPPFSVEH